ncbi:hypothetical protein [Streptomyces mangrovisoli]|uniref:Plasmid stabilization protein n=1 Tax=Streptomyces mangrovisoli TaxID=1428628 RepID=A0A1J4P4J0_9ACTN|nr:hypothetical protein [Streptomyces mangrovisoli]OIJ68366.1 plasmid stabilization protein [Streptomyces mangrovisoli]
MAVGSSADRERQYEDVRRSAEDRDESHQRVREIASRMMDKERARSDETRTAGRSSPQDAGPAPRRGGQRSHSGSQEPTKDQLYEEARKRDIDGRSSMSKQQLKDALGR